MMRLIREFIRLIETRSRWDHEASRIIKQIIEWLKDDPSQPLQIDGLVGAYVTFHRAGNRLHIGGIAQEDEPYINITVTVPSDWSDNDLRRSLFEIRSKLKDVVRHEVEHARDVVMGLTEPTPMPSGLKAPLKGLAALRQYLFRPDEIRAYSVGMYRRAQDSRRNVTDIMSITLDEVREWIMKEGEDPKSPEAKDFLKELENVWWIEIMRRFPRVREK